MKNRQKCKHFAILRILTKKDFAILRIFGKINLRISAFFDKIICVWQRSKVLCQDIFIEKMKIFLAISKQFCIFAAKNK